MRKAVVRVCAGVLLAGLTSGCSPLTEQERYERADRLNQAREQFAARQELCEQLGGKMSMSVRPLEKPGYLDYRSASCIRR